MHTAGQTSEQDRGLGGPDRTGRPAGSSDVGSLQVRRVGSKRVGGLGKGCALFFSLAQHSRSLRCRNDALSRGSRLEACLGARLAPAWTRATPPLLRALACFDDFALPWGARLVPPHAPPVPCVILSVPKLVMMPLPLRLRGATGIGEGQSAQTREGAPLR
jgi:hypothetical protein